MKKLLILVLFCMMSVMPVFAAAISDNYCNASLGTVCLSVNDIREMTNTQGIGNNEVDNAVKTIANSLQERFGLNLDKDIEHIGTFVVPSATGGVGFIGFITGDFNSKQKIQMIASSLQSFSEETKIEKVQIAGKSIGTLVDNGLRIVFMNPNTILIGEEGTMKLVLSGEITLGKASEIVTNLLGRSESFALVNGAVLGFLAAIPEVPQEVKTVAAGCSNISVFVKDSLLNIDLIFTNGEKAANVKSITDDFINKYTEQNKKTYSDAESKLKEVSMKEYFSEAKKLYSAAKALEGIKQLKISQTDNRLCIVSKYDKTQLIIGAVGIGASMAIPNFKKARESARAKACYSNQRVISGAVEMYNMDHVEMMTSLDVQKLVKERYLKVVPSKPEPDCDYLSDGDLTSDGKITCKKHGSVFDYKK